ncbi:hypothetical protein MID07_18470 [Acinetobacter seifertii]|uniref:hypothetical protein n=1 Tax=Acinetobacter seifertii TaxID=1530123 RepID=UPI001F029994|nr:hypothetical protein [Acinetobacter seifertii]MCG8286590.1 hypothetical protein [Acinetobacter seifertii]
MLNNIKWLLAGVLIPVIGVILTWYLNQRELKYELEYTYQGPITTALGTSYSLTITNTGKQIQEDIEIWIPTSLLTLNAREIELKLDSTVHKIKDSSLIEISNPQVKFEEIVDKDYKVLKFKSLRPSENITFSVLSLGNLTSIDSEYSLEQLRIVSKHSVAKVIKKNDALLKVYQVLAYVFIILILGLVILGIVFEYFYPKDKKIRMYEKEIYKLKGP